MRRSPLVLLALVLAVQSCRKDTDEPMVMPPADPEQPTSPVVFDPEAVPYATLSEYHFFDGELKDLQPVYGVLPFEPISPLFSDYAHKKRFIWMPGVAQAEYVADEELFDFDDGTVLIKNFYYENVQPAGDTRILETRLMYKLNGQWEFANYVWNEDQTEANFDLVGSYVPLSWVDEQGATRDVVYRIPNEAECLTCHKNNVVPIPIGPKPQNLNSTLAYPEGSMNQLAKWASMGYLNGNYPSTIATTVRWDDPAQELDLRVRSYLDMNCATCHSDSRHCDYRSMRFAFDDTEDPVNLGVCVEPDDPIVPGQTHIVSSGYIERSMLYYRITATAEEERMPLIGRTLVHEEAVAMIEEWINSLSPACE